MEGEKTRILIMFQNTETYTIAIISIHDNDRFNLN